MHDATSTMNSLNLPNGVIDQKSPIQLDAFNMMCLGVSERGGPQISLIHCEPKTNAALSPKIIEISSYKYCPSLDHIRAKLSDAMI
jgi:hypothetical protein